jgi:hypothetical protein
MIRSSVTTISAKVGRSWGFIRQQLENRSLSSASMSAGHSGGWPAAIAAYLCTGQVVNREKGRKKTEFQLLPRLESSAGGKAQTHSYSHCNRSFRKPMRPFVWLLTRAGGNLQFPMHGNMECRIHPRQSSDHRPQPLHIQNLSLCR